MQMLGGQCSSSTSYVKKLETMGSLRSPSTSPGAGTDHIKAIQLRKINQVLEKLTTSRREALEPAGQSTAQGTGRQAVQPRLLLFSGTPLRSGVRRDKPTVASAVALSAPQTSAPPQDFRISSDAAVWEVSRRLEIFRRREYMHSSSQRFGRHRGWLA